MYRQLIACLVTKIHPFCNHFIAQVLTYHNLLWYVNLC